MLTRSHNQGVAKDGRRRFLPQADGLESRELLNAGPVFGNSPHAYINLPGVAAATPLPPIPTSFHNSGPAVLIGGGLRTIPVNTASPVGVSTIGTVGTNGGAGNIRSAFINLPNNVNPNLLNGSGAFTNITNPSAGNLNGLLSAGFGVLTGLAFNNGLGGFGNSNGLGAQTGLVFNNGLGGFGNSNALGTQTGLVFNNGFGGFGSASNLGFGTQTGLVFNNGLGGFGFGSPLGNATSNGLIFTGGQGFSNPFVNPFFNGASNLLAGNRNLTVGTTGLNTIATGAGGFNGLFGAGSVSGVGVNPFIGMTGTTFI